MTKPLQQPRTGRLLSLDVLRGLTIAGMILVTDPGTYSHAYAPLMHAPWTGGSPTDLIFPAFLVMSGMSLTLSFSARLARGLTRTHLLLHSTRRAVLLILLGIFLNAFPTFDWHTVRLPGILQRIAVCYLAATVLYLAATLPAFRRHFSPLVTLSAACVALLLSYGLILRLIPAPGFPGQAFTEAGNLSGFVDRAIFTTRHLWPYGTAPGYGVMFDPEGVLSTLGALATTLMGVIAGLWLRAEASAAKRLLALVGGSVLLIAAGFALSPVLPVIKKIWTPSFACISGGCALLLFAFLYWLVDVQGIKRWTPPALVFGTNAILAFAVSTVITTLLQALHHDGLTLHQYGYEHFFLPWLSPINASLAYALTVTAFNLLLILPLYRNRIYLRL